MLSGSHMRREVRLATVSGILTTTVDMIRYADMNLGALSMLTTKSFQVMPNQGNREPVIAEPEPGCFGNSVGLRNPGMEAAVRGLEQLRRRHPLRSILNVSISGSSPEEFIILARAFAHTADILELNFSCPHAADGYGSSIGSSWRIASSYMEKIRRELTDDFPVPIFPKLTPNTEELAEIALSLMKSGADGLAAVNTVGPELYIEPYSGKPILQNTLGGKGGKSGKWIRQRAIDAVREIRNAVGDETVLLGMGGVFTGKDAAEMINAGADTVGLGSVFGKVHQRNWEAFSQTVLEEAQGILSGSSTRSIFSGPSSRSYQSQVKHMEYQPFKVISVRDHSSQVKLLTLEGSISYKAGEFVFLWIPGTGEKPFSAALGHPLTFVVKERGEFTRKLCSMMEGETVYIRGTYGEEAPVCSEPRAVLAAGGTGIAVLPALARSLHEAGRQVSMFYGASDDSETRAPLQEELEKWGTVTAVPDKGIPGRVLKYVVPELKDCALYAVGPEPFMRLAASKALEAGIDKQSIFLSLEQITLCGVGLCGACSCAGRLTCQYGTFMPLDVIEEHDQEEIT